MHFKEFYTLNMSNNSKWIDTIINPIKSEIEEYFFFKKGDLVRYLDCWTTNPKLIRCHIIKIVICNCHPDQQTNACLSDQHYNIYIQPIGEKRIIIIRNIEEITKIN